MLVKIGTQRVSIIVACFCALLAAPACTAEEGSAKGLWSHVVSGYGTATHAASQAYSGARETIMPDVVFEEEMHKDNPFAGKTLAEIRAWLDKALQHLVDIKMGNSVADVQQFAKRLKDICLSDDNHFAKEYGRYHPAEARRVAERIDGVRIALRAALRDLDEAHAALTKAAK